MWKVLIGVLAFIGERLGDDAPSGEMKEEALLSITRFGFLDIELVREAWDYFFLILFAVRGLYLLLVYG